MFRYCRRILKRSGDVARRLASAAQQIENCTPRGVGQSLERRFLRICKPNGSA